jgi:hypothetical protein
MGKSVKEIIMDEKTKELRVISSIDGKIINDEPFDEITTRERISIASKKLEKIDKRMAPLQSRKDKLVEEAAGLNILLEQVKAIKMK